MDDLARFDLTGRVGHDPELRPLPNERLCAKLSIACDKSWLDGDGERQGHTSWFHVWFFGPPAEFVRDHITKGREVFVTGELRHDTYERNGERVHVTQLIGTRIKPCGAASARSRSSKPQSTTRAASPSVPPTPAPAPREQAPGPQPPNPFLATAAAFGARSERD